MGDQAGIEGEHHRAVFWLGIFERPHRRQAARARHVLNDHGWISGDVFSHVARERAIIGVITAARRESDDNRDGLARVERGLRGGRCRMQRHRSEKTNECTPYPNHEWTSVHSCAFLGADVRREVHQFCRARNRIYDESRVTRAFARLCARLAGQVQLGQNCRKAR